MKFMRSSMESKKHKTAQKKRSSLLVAARFDAYASIPWTIEFWRYDGASMMSCLCHWCTYHNHAQHISNSNLSCHVKRK